MRGEISSRYHSSIGGFTEKKMKTRSDFGNVQGCRNPPVVIVGDCFLVELLPLRKESGKVRVCAPDSMCRCVIFVSEVQ